jgi:hypothetical protein
MSGLPDHDMPSTHPAETSNYQEERRHIEHGEFAEDCGRHTKGGKWRNALAATAFPLSPFSE